MAPNMKPITTDVAVAPPSPDSPKRSAARPDLPASSSFALRELNTTLQSKPLPDGITRADVYVDCQVCLERKQDKENEHRTKLANNVKQAVENKLKGWYSGTKEDAPYTLKVYVVIASEGSVVNALSLGMVGTPTEECLEWFLQTSDGSETFKAGRVGSDKDGTSLFAGTEHKLLTEKIPKRLACDIVNKLDIANRSAAMKCQS